MTPDPKDWKEIRAAVAQLGAELEDAAYHDDTDPDHAVRHAATAAAVGVYVLRELALIREGQDGQIAQLESRLEALQGRLGETGELIASALSRLVQAVDRTS